MAKFRKFLRKKRIPKLQAGGTVLPNFGVQSGIGRATPARTNFQFTPANTSAVQSGINTAIGRQRTERAAFDRDRDFLTKFTQSFKTSTSGVDGNLYDLSDPVQRGLAQEDAQMQARAQAAILNAGVTGAGLRQAQQLIQENILHQTSGDRLLYKGFNTLRAQYNSILTSSTTNQRVNNYALADEVRQKENLFFENRDQASLIDYRDALKQYAAAPSLDNKAVEKIRENLLSIAQNPLELLEYSIKRGVDPVKLKGAGNPREMTRLAIADLINKDATTRSVFMHDAALAGKDFDQYRDDWVTAVFDSAVPSDNNLQTANDANARAALSERNVANTLETQNNSRDNAIQVAERKAELKAEAAKTSGNSTTTGGTKPTVAQEKRNAIIQELADAGFTAPASVIQDLVDKDILDAEGFQLNASEAVQFITGTSPESEEFRNRFGVKQATQGSLSGSTLRTLQANPIISKLPEEQINVAQSFLENEPAQDGFFNDVWFPRVINETNQNLATVSSIESSVESLLGTEDRARELKLQYLTHHHGQPKAKEFLETGRADIKGNPQADEQLKIQWERIDNKLAANPDISTSDLFAELESDQRGSLSVNSGSSAIGKHQILFKANAEEIENYLNSNGFPIKNSDADNDGLVEDPPFSRSTGQTSSPTTAPGDSFFN